MQSIEPRLHHGTTARVTHHDKLRKDCLRWFEYMSKLRKSFFVQVNEEKGQTQEHIDESCENK